MSEQSGQGPDYYQGLQFSKEVEPKPTRNLPPATTRQQQIQLGVACIVLTEALRQAGYGDNIPPTLDIAAVPDQSPQS